MSLEPLCSVFPPDDSNTLDSIRDEHGIVVEFGHSLGVDYLKTLKEEVSVTLTSCDHLTLSITQGRKLGISGAVWDCGELLVRCLDENVFNLQNMITNASILELGSGTAIVGIASAFLGASRVVCTDQAKVVSLMKTNILNCLPQIKKINKNIPTDHHLMSTEDEKRAVTEDEKRAVTEDEQINKRAVPEIHALTFPWNVSSGWSFEGGFKIREELWKNSYDVILCADCLYDVSQFSHFTQALLCATDQHTTVVMTYKKRLPERDKKAFEHLAKWFEIGRVPDEDLPTNFRGKHLFLFILKRKFKKTLN